MSPALFAGSLACDVSCLMDYLSENLSVKPFFLAGLYTKGLIYIDVPIADDDYIVGKE